MIKPLVLHALGERFGGGLEGDEFFTFYSLNTDTRTIVHGDLFVALVGEHFDAHDYLDEAIEKGAKGLVVNKSYQPQKAFDTSISIWRVDDTCKALGQIATYHRDLFLQPLVAVTGSSGKTTVKGMLFKIFSAYVGQQAVFATKGNLNNHIGVPFSLLSLTRQHQYAVIEMGASAGGEIAYLTSMAKPAVALVNNVMPAHVEGFGSVDAIAIAKGEIYEGLKEGGVAVINAGDVYADQWIQQNQRRSTVLFSSAEHGEVRSGVDVYSRKASRLKNGCYSFCLVCGDQAVVVKLNVLGQHNIANATAAAACAFAAGINIEFIRKGLEAFNGESGRLQVFSGKDDCTLIDDTYNANPGSVKAAMDVLATMPGNTIFVLGDMGELGVDADFQHREMGRYAAQKNIQQLLTLGEKSALAQAAFGNTENHFLEVNALVERLSKEVASDVVILAKGSRSSRMERVINALKKNGDNDASLVC